jgi:two-component system sensor histidine kinase RpfC
MMRRLKLFLLSARRGLARRLHSRPDTEFEQAALRAAIMLAVYGYFYYLFTFGQTDLSFAVRQQILHVFGPLLLALSFILLIRIAFDKKISPPRRLAGAVIDISSCSYFLYLSDEAGAILLVVYLWVTLGNGFRYGLRYLIFSASISLVGFGLVMGLSPFWQQHVWLDASMLLMLVLIPLYAGFLIQKLHRAVKLAHEASLAKSSFLANMSHELRTPLNGVIGIADLLRETPLNKEQTELTQAIHASAMTLHKLIENVLDISRIEAGKLTFLQEDYDLHQLLNTMSVMLEPQAHRKGLLLGVHIAPRTPYLLHGDVQHLRQVLVNLIGNAIKFTEHGRVDVYVRPFTEDKQGWLRFEVADTGIGIPLEKQGRIFESFVQADASVTRRYGGTGLGTSISRQLVEMMGGRIGLVSQPGEGTTFWFEFPVQVQERRQARASLPGTLRVAMLANPEFSYRLGEIIRSWGGEVIPMNGQAEAMLHLMAEPGPAPDAMVVERGLLGEDPAQFVRLLHDSPGLAHFPAILIDPDASERQVNAWMKAGYSSVLQSPVNPTLLFSALHEAASHKELPDNVVSLAEHFQAKAGRTRLLILVAEDNPINQRVMRGLLEHAGHEVVMAGNGEEALALLEANAGKLNLAVVDMHMPGLSGPEAVKRWRFMEKGHLPIIMLTADARGEAEQQCREAGADDFLTKPVNSRMLLDKLAQLALSAKIETAKSAGGRRQSTAAVLDESVLKDLADFGGGLEFVRDLIEEFRQDSARALQATRQALEERNYGAWKDHLHMLKGGASDVGALAMADACAEAERIKPFEITQALASERLAAVNDAKQAALAAMEDFLARQQSARGM